MKAILFSILLILVSCNQEANQHDGRYFTTVEVFGTKFCDVTYQIEGDEITVNNSITGISKINCQQYSDRIEYQENGVTRVMTILKNGDINVNGQIVLQKAR